MSHNPALPPVKDGKVWCPLCADYFQMLRVRNAAKLADVHQRTIYRYIEEGKIYATRLAGTNYRVCSNCLFKPKETDNKSAKSCHRKKE